MMILNLSKIVSQIRYHIELLLIKRSPYFDSTFYSSNYKDLKNTPRLEEHYLLYGSKENRQPSRYVSYEVIKWCSIRCINPAVFLYYCQLSKYKRYLLNLILKKYPKNFVKTYPFIQSSELYFDEFINAPYEFEPISQSYFIHKNNLKIFLPVYNRLVNLTKYVPKVFNDKGEPLIICFLRDKVSSHDPYLSGQRSFLFDRYNYMLPIHFYTNDCMTEICGRPEKSYLVMAETSGVVPEQYEFLLKNNDIASQFDLIFTSDERLLKKYKNCRNVQLNARPWYGTAMGGGKLDPNLYKSKTKNLSIVSSNKRMCKLHSFRIDVAKLVKEKNFGDTFGNFDDVGKNIKISESLTKYRFSICIENCIGSFFTERITNCFASMTIPIYLGATNIGDYFNMDGIIPITEHFNIEEIMNIISIKCTKEYYEEHLEAVIDNYHRVQKYYETPFDYIKRKYFSNGF